jgi:nucleotide-binding universal stress UspA family protein
MNTLRHLLVHINDGVLSREALQLGAALARQHGAQMTALLAVEPIAPGAYLSPETASLAAQLVREHMASHRLLAQDLVHSVGQAHAMAVDLQVADGAPVDALIRSARVTDLLVVSQRDAQSDAEKPGGLDAGASARLLVGAGCPVIFVPHIGWSQGGARPDGPVAQNILVAWSDTRESARALRDALPLLQAARRVELVTFVGADADEADPTPEALNAAHQHLQRHGVQASVTVRRSREPTFGERMRRAWVPDASIAEALLSHAADTQVDLIVMGGYGHPRAWELVLGGVTRTLLQTMTVPVFMSH